MMFVTSFMKVIFIEGIMIVTMMMKTTTEIMTETTTKIMTMTNMMSLKINL